MRVGARRRGARRAPAPAGVAPAPRSPARAPRPLPSGRPPRPGQPPRGARARRRASPASGPSAWRRRGQAPCRSRAPPAPPLPAPRRARGSARRPRPRRPRAPAGGPSTSGMGVRGAGVAGEGLGRRRRRVGAHRTRQAPLHRLRVREGRRDVGHRVQLGRALVVVHEDDVVVLIVRVSREERLHLGVDERRPGLLLDRGSGRGGGGRRDLGGLRLGVPRRRGQLHRLAGQALDLAQVDARDGGVLVLEDPREVQELIRRVLAPAGAEVRVLELLPRLDVLRRQLDDTLQADDDLVGQAIAEEDVDLGQQPGDVGLWVDVGHHRGARGDGLLDLDGGLLDVDGDRLQLVVLLVLVVVDDLDVLLRGGLGGGRGLVVDQIDPVNLSPLTRRGRVHVQLTVACLAPVVGGTRIAMKKPHSDAALRACSLHCKEVREPRGRDASARGRIEGHFTTASRATGVDGGGDPNRSVRYPPPDVLVAHPVHFRASPLWVQRRSPVSTRGGTRTHTSLRTLDFESSLSRLEPQRRHTAGDRGVTSRPAAASHAPPVKSSESARQAARRHRHNRR